MPSSITLTVAHLPTSTSFFLSALQPLSYVYRGRVNDTIGFGYPDAAPDFWITQSIPGVPPGPAHVAFPATSRGIVHDFFHAALKAGGKVHGEPALRDDCGYYSAAIIDFDGNSIEAVFRPDLLEANKENIDDTKSGVSMTKSVARSKAPSQASSASKTKSIAPSRVGSVAPSNAAKSSISQAQSVVPARAPTSAQRSTLSRAPTVSGAPSEAPARTTISRTSTAPAVTQSTGNGLSDILDEARGTVAFARDLVDQARPLMSSSASPTPKTAGALASSSDSHGPSDAIVGTLLGVAAGAALHYAFTNHNKPTVTASAPVTPPEHYHNRGVAPSESAPSWTQERYYYYHQQEPRALPAPSQTPTRPYAIEAPPSEFSRASSKRSGTGQRLIEMVDNDPTLSEIAPSTIKPRRRSSFSAVSAARSTTSKRSAAPSVKLLEGPPTSYRAPTAITMQSDAGRSRRSRASSLTRSTTKATDEGYASANEVHDRKSKASRHSHSRSHRRSSSSSRHTAITAIKPTTPSETPLPPSRPASHIDDRDSFYSTHSKAAKTVIGRLTERQLSKLEEGGRLNKGQTDVTRSVIGKVKEVDSLDLSRKELRPEDSVSQVSSSRGSRRSRR